MNPSRRFGHSFGVGKGWMATIVVLAANWACADIAWDFSQVDTRSGGNGGVYAYVYPNSTSRHSPAHEASLERIASGTTYAAKLSYVLDGSSYPSAGFGLMFPQAQSLDLRRLRSIHLHLSSDRRRKVRLSLSSRIPAYEGASDTGVSLGRDTVVGPDGLDWTIPAADLTWPKWVADEDIPDISDLAILASAWAVQLNVSCEAAKGSCALDTGWLRVDSLRLEGVGLTWPAPTEGACSGNPVDLSAFSSGKPKRNGLGGWWYAYTDASSSDTSAQGASRILSAPDTTVPSSWVPDSTDDLAHLRFHLIRKGSNSGYAALETQFGAPDNSGYAVPVDLPTLSSVSFQLDFDSSFPSSLVGGVVLHAKKSGKAFSNGQDHQVRIPYDSVPRRWCLDFDSLQQPIWSAWGQTAFTLDSLLAMSWEAKIQSDADDVIGGFKLSAVKLWFSNTAVRRVPTAAWSVSRHGTSVELRRPDGCGILRAEIVDARGRLLAWTTAAGSQTSVLLRTDARGPSWVRLRDDRGLRVLVVPPGI
jgi:hypothetical protein